MRETAGRNAPQVADVAAWATEHGVDLRTVELDVQSDASVEAGIAKIIAEAGRLDVIVHNAGHMVVRPGRGLHAGAVRQQYDVNVLGTQRVNRAALPHCASRARACWSGFGSSLDARRHAAVPGALFRGQGGDGCARRVLLPPSSPAGASRPSIIVPGAFTKGTNHFAHSGKPADTARAAEYEAGPYAGVADQALKGLAGLEPADADPAEVARAIVEVVDMPFGKRPFRVHVDPSQDGAEIVNGVADRMRREIYRNIGLEDLLHPAVVG